MHKIKEMLMQELYEYEEKAKKMNGGKISAGDLETLHKLTDTVKNIDKIEMLEDSEYSEESRYSRDGGMSYVRGGGRGRGRNARRDSMGRYSREGGYSEEYSEEYDGGMMYARGGQGGGQGGNRGGGSRGGRGGGGYSRDGAKEHMLMKMEEMLDMADSEEQRRAIRHCMAKIEEA